MGILKLKCFTISLAFLTCTAASSNGGHKLTDRCLTNGDCEAGLICSSCLAAFSGSICVRSTATNLFKLVNYSLPYNKYAYLTTHNSFAITGKTLHPDAEKLRLTFTNQEDSVTNQLNNGVRALMLDTYDYQNDVWLCHSRGGVCRNVTAFTPVINTFKEIEAFLAANPSEIVTIILEDYVKAKNGLTNVFKASGLSKYWFPCSEMPANGRNWPSVSNMIGKNQRLVVFTSMQSKQATEGIAYQWNYMVENNYGDTGMKSGMCSNRRESSPLTDKKKSLVMVNYFPTIPIRSLACKHNSQPLLDMLHACNGAASNRWANFVVVDYYKRSMGGGSFQATDMCNGRLLCGRDDVHVCNAHP